MVINSIHIYNMFKKVLFKDLNEMLGDYKEIIENISDCDDDDDLADQKFEQIDNFCSINNCDHIVSAYGVVKAIKLYIDTFGDSIDFDESESTIYKKLAFVIIYEYLHFVDLNIFNQFMKENCNHLIYIDDNEDMFNYIESSIKNHYYNVSNKFYPIF